jgi:hypothetical protein
VKSALLVVLALVALGCNEAENTQNLPVGSRCSHDSTCGTSPYRCTVSGYPGGYCDKACATDGDCPADSWCYPLLGCRRSCQADPAACRTSEGYTCIQVPSRSYCDVPAPPP